VISILTASLMPSLRPLPRACQQYHEQKLNTSKLTKLTSVTLQLPFRPSAIKRPPTSVNLLFHCITRRYTSPLTRLTHNTISRIQPHQHSAPTPLKTHITHAPAHQVNVLQALESPQIGAQGLDIVVPHLYLQQNIM
jgi:hypothetical protein